MKSDKPAGWYWVWAESREYPGGRWEIVEVTASGEVLVVDSGRLDIERWGQAVKSPR